MSTYGKTGTLRAGKIHYDAAGDVTQADEDAFMTQFKQIAPDNVFIMSHGWNNDEADADKLYNAFFTAAENVWSAFPSIDRAKSLILAVIWPSKKFDENVFAGVAGALPGGTSAAGPGVVHAASLASNAVDVEIVAQLNVLKEIAGNDAATALLDHAILQIPNLGVSQSAQDDFVSAVARAFPAPPQGSDPGLDQGFSNIVAMQGHVVLQTIAQTLGTQTVVGAIAGAPANGNVVKAAALTIGGSAPLSVPLVSAAGFNPLQAIKNAALALANVTTYWAMKERAGIVGVRGVAQTLAKMLALRPSVKLHLIGHSFGGRLVTAAANALPGGAATHQVSTMLLLQAAYSHFGMAKNYWPNVDGVFRSIITSSKVKSQIQITHSVHDVAVGLAYPIASALASQIGQGLFVNPWGGMGSDGAQSTPEAVNEILRSPASPYRPLVTPSKVRNLNGDALIRNHGDVTHDEIAYAMLSAVSAS